MQLTASLVPSLTPVTIMPTRPSVSTEPRVFLQKIDHIEINGTVERNGVVYYVLNVYLKQTTNRIPTNKRPVEKMQRNRPDYQLEKRFNEFADFRYQVWAYAQRKHGGCTCKYCDDFMDYIVYSMAQPRLVVKLATGVQRRMALFTKFCNEFVAMAVGKNGEDRPRYYTCEGYHAIPTIVERFLRKE